MSVNGVSRTGNVQDLTFSRVEIHSQFFFFFSNQVSGGPFAMFHSHLHY